MANIYRKAALDKISSPDQLDQAITISSPLSWLVVAAVGLIIAVTIVWACVTPQSQTVDVMLINTEYYSVYRPVQNPSGENIDKNDLPKVSGKLLCLVPASYNLPKFNSGDEKSDIGKIQIQGQKIGHIDQPNQNSVLTDEQLKQMFWDHAKLVDQAADCIEFEVQFEGDVRINNIPPYSVAQLVIGTKRPIEYVNEFFKRGD